MNNETKLDIQSDNNCAQVCNTLNNRIELIKGVMSVPENIGIKGIKRVEYYIESLEHLKSELEDSNICKCDVNMNRYSKYDRNIRRI